MQKGDSISDGQPLTKQSQDWLAILSLLIAATLWGLFWYPLRILEQNGLSGLWATLFIYLGTLPVLLTLFWQKRHSIHSNITLLFAIALASGWTNTTFIIAILDGSVVRVLILFYLSPFWATILGVLILKEKILLHTILTLTVALCGAVLMLWDSKVGLPLPVSSSDWLALSSGFAFALTNVFTRLASHTPVALKMTASWSGTIFISASAILLTSTGIANVEPLYIVIAIAIGLTLMVFMTTAVVYGVSKMPIQRSAIILLFELIAGAISASLLTNETVSTWEWLGGGCILVAGYLSARSYIKNKQVQ